MKEGVGGGEGSPVLDPVSDLPMGMAGVERKVPPQTCTCPYHRPQCLDF